MKSQQEHKDKAEKRLSDAFKISQYRRYMGMSQESAAELLGISQPSYCNMEYGRCKISEEDMQSMKILFDAWRDSRIFYLEQKINELKSVE